MQYSQRARSCWRQRGLYLALIVMLTAGSAMGATVVYDKTGLRATNGIVVQNFEVARSSMECEAADDFTLTAAAEIGLIDLSGVYSGGAAVSTVYVRITDDQNGPGADQCTRTATVIADDDGYLTIDLGTPCSLDAGLFWLVVQADLEYADGQWFWNGSEEAADAHAQWINPGGGFPTLCTNWGTLPDCFGGSEVSFVFSLSSPEDPLIFEDDFETSDTSAWSVTVP